VKAAGSGFPISGDAPAHPPETERTTDDGQAEKYRHFIALEGPVAVGRLVHQDFPELAYACGRGPTLDAGCLTEEVPANCVTGLIDDPI
jgi:hypothetical protein